MLTSALMVKSSAGSSVAWIKACTELCFWSFIVYNHELWLKKEPISSKNTLDEAANVLIYLGFYFQKHVSF